MSKFLKNNFHIILVLFIAVLFFFGASAFNYKTQSYSPTGENDFVKWNSPDESANYIFTKLYAQTGELVIQENYNIITKDIMHPRSVRADYGRLKPMSFLGMTIYYGQIAKYLGYKAIPYLTPFFAAAAIVFYYLLLRKIFNRSNALISTMLLAALPPYIYFSSRSMFHNVFFVSALIMASYFVYSAFAERKIGKKSLKQKIFKFFSIKKPKQGTLFKETYRLKFFKPKRVFLAVIGGILLGIAIGARSSELIWIFPAMLLIWLVNIRKVNLVTVFFLFLGILAGLSPVLYNNEYLFGSYFFGGYAEMNQSIINIGSAGTDLVKLNNISEAGQRIKDSVFYFGIHPEFSLKMAYKYFVEMFAYLFWPMAMGLLFVLAQPRKYKQRVWVWLVSFAIVSGVLVLYYGSWEFHDNPDPNQFTIGNSYTRYWLPVYIMALPFAGLAIMRITRGISSLFFLNKKTKLSFFKNRKNKQLIYWPLRAIILILVMLYSVNFVLSRSDDSLIYLTQRQLDSRYEFNRILDLTESNSTIITRYHDKLLFPERKVIVGLFDDPAMVNEYANLANYLPVYYYNFTFPEEDFKYLNERRLKEAGLQIELIENVTGDFSLYRLRQIAENR